MRCEVIGRIGCAEIGSWDTAAKASAASNTRVLPVVFVTLRTFGHDLPGLRQEGSVRKSWWLYDVYLTRCVRSDLLRHLRAVGALALGWPADLSCAAISVR